MQAVPRDESNCKWQLADVHSQLPRAPNLPPRTWKGLTTKGFRSAVRLAAASFIQAGRDSPSPAAPAGKAARGLSGGEASVMASCTAQHGLKCHQARHLNTKTTHYPAPSRASRKSSNAAPSTCAFSAAASCFPCLPRTGCFLDGEPPLPLALFPAAAFEPVALPLVGACLVALPARPRAAPSSAAPSSCAATSYCIPLPDFGAVACLPGLPGGGIPSSAAPSSGCGCWGRLALRQPPAGCAGAGGCAARCSASLFPFTRAAGGGFLAGESASSLTSTPSSPSSADPCACCCLRLVWPLTEWARAVTVAPERAEAVPTAPVYGDLCSFSPL